MNIKTQLISRKPSVWEAVLSENVKATGSSRAEATTNLLTLIEDAVKLERDSRARLSQAFQDGLEREQKREQKIEKYVTGVLAIITDTAMKKRAQKAVEFFRKAVADGVSITPDHDHDRFIVNGHKVDLANITCDCQDLVHGKDDDGNKITACYHIMAARLMRRWYKL